MFKQEFCLNMPRAKARGALFIVNMKNTPQFWIELGDVALFVFRSAPDFLPNLHIIVLNGGYNIFNAGGFTGIE